MPMVSWVQNRLQYCWDEYEFLGARIWKWVCVYCWVSANSDEIPVDKD